MKKTTSQEPKTITIDIETFEERFTLKKNHLVDTPIWGGCAFETYEDEYEYVREHPESTIWTMIEEDDTRVIISGLHIVNRLYYLISEEAVPENIEYIVPIP